MAPCAEIPMRPKIMSAGVKSQKSYIAIAIYICTCTRELELAFKFAVNAIIQLRPHEYARAGMWQPPPGPSIALPSTPGHRGVLHVLGHPTHALNLSCLWAQTGEWGAKFLSTPPFCTVHLHVSHIWCFFEVFPHELMRVGDMEAHNSNATRSVSHEEKQWSQVHEPSLVWTCWSDSVPFARLFYGPFSNLRKWLCRVVSHSWVAMGSAQLNKEALAHG